MKKYDAFKRNIEVGDTVIAHVARRNSLIEGTVTNIGDYFVTVKSKKSGKKYLAQHQNVFGLFGCDDIDDAALRLEEHKAFQEYDIDDWCWYNDAVGEALDRFYNKRK